MLKRIPNATIFTLEFIKVVALFKEENGIIYFLLLLLTQVKGRASWPTDFFLNESFLVLKHAMQSHSAGYTQVQILVLLLSNSLGKLLILYKLYFCYYKKYWIKNSPVIKKYWIKNSQLLWRLNEENYIKCNKVLEIKCSMSTTFPLIFVIFENNKNL